MVSSFITDIAACPQTDHRNDLTEWTKRNAKKTANEFDNFQLT